MKIKDFFSPWKGCIQTSTQNNKSEFKIKVASKIFSSIHISLSFSKVFFAHNCSLNLGVNISTSVSLFLLSQPSLSKDVILTVFSLMFAPFCNRISITFPFPLQATRCNGVWNQNIKNKSLPISLNVNTPSATKIFPIMHYSSINKEILFLSLSMFTSNHLYPLK